jgi:DNA modification methylase
MENWLMQGDCLKKMDWIQDGSVDMVLADLPYGTTACKWDTRIPFEPLWKELHRVCKPHAAMCMFGSEPFSSLMRMSNLKRFKYDWVWDKVRGVGFQIAKYRPMSRHEIVSVFCEKTPSYFPIMVSREKPKISKCYTASKSSPLAYNDGLSRTYTEKFPTSILTISNASQVGKVHPTQKPVALLEYLIKTYTNEGDTVLDPTMGSGSTGVAGKNLGRKFIGIEMDEKYFKIAKERIDHA